MLSNIILKLGIYASDRDFSVNLLIKQFEDKIHNINSNMINFNEVEE